MANKDDRYPELESQKIPVHWHHDPYHMGHVKSFHYVHAAHAEELVVEIKKWAKINKELLDEIKAQDAENEGRSKEYQSLCREHKQLRLQHEAMVLMQEIEAISNTRTIYQGEAIIELNIQLHEALRAILPYAQNHEDEGPHGTGWQSDKLVETIKRAEKALARMGET